MKNLVFNLAIALVVIAYVGGVFESKKEVKASGNNSSMTSPAVNTVFTEEKSSAATGSDKQKNIESVSVDLNASALGNNPKNTNNKTGIASIRIERVAAEDNEISKLYFPREAKALSSEVIESIFAVRNQKIIDEIIAEDNAIIGNDTSNEKTADLSNVNLSIDTIVFDKSGKTIEEIIAEDNAIIGNNLPNEASAADLLTENRVYNIAIDTIPFIKEGKTIDEIIAQDNAITENNASNEAMALDFK